MNCIFSIRKQYSDLIFDKIKPIEFRNKLPKIEKGDKIYVYETKNKGCGMVIGYFVVKETREIPHNKIGTYIYMDLYAKMFCDEETQNQINKAKKINLNGYDNSLVLSCLFRDDCLNEMMETHLPPSNFIPMNSQQIKEFNDIKKKQDNFCSNCDTWLTKIGFYNEYDESLWKYEILIDDVVRFKTPIPITNFKLQNGNYLKRAPQSFCYIQEG